MYGNLSGLISNLALATSTTNYVLLNRIATNESVYDLLDIEIKIDILEQYACVNEEFISELEEIIETNFSSSDSDIVEVMDYITRKLAHAYNCCEEDIGNKKRNPNECSICEHDLLSLTKLLKDIGYINVDELIEAVAGETGLTTSIVESTNVMIPYGINVGSIDFTKLLNRNSLAISNYSLNMHIYDDKIETPDISCYFENPPSLSLKKQSSSFIEDVIIINYDGQYKAFLKATVTSDLHPFAKETYIFNPNEKWNEITSTAMSETNRIYENEGFNGIFNFILLNEEQNNNLEISMRFKDIWIEIKDEPAGSSCFYGMMALAHPAMWEHSNNLCAWGSYVNVPSHNWSADPESIGYTMSHEFGHFLTARGRWVAGEILGYKNASFHDDSEPNLMSSADVSGNLPSDRNESLTPLVKYLIYLYLFCGQDCNY